MKPAYYFVLLVLCFWINNTDAQTTFAPPGAEWYNLFNDGEYHKYNVHSYNDGDTILLGQPCQKIVEKIAVPPGSWLSDSTKTFFSYTSGDTVFMYNNCSHIFSPLYIFNVTEGDTIRIPDFYEPYTVRFRVDSVKMVQYDTATLKTVYTQMIDTTALPGVSGWFTYGFKGGKTGAYAVRIGGVWGGIYPNCYGCAVIPEGCGCVGPPICYNDPSMSIKLTTGPCDPPVAVPVTKEPETFSLYPNPATDVIMIQTIQEAIVTITSIDGRMIYNTAIPPNKSVQTDLTKFSAGSYFVRWLPVSGTPQYSRLQIGH